MLCLCTWSPTASAAGSPPLSLAPRRLPLGNVDVIVHLVKDDLQRHANGEPLPEPVVLAVKDVTHKEQISLFLQLHHDHGIGDLVLEPGDRGVIAYIVGIEGAPAAHLLKLQLRI